MNIETENHKNIVSFDSALFESYAKDQVCQEPISDAENIHLYNLRHDRQSIIIDSIDSRIAPHIAITPTTSDETWEEYTRVMTDMAPPCPCCLQLPQRTNWADAMPPIAAPNHSHEWLSEAPTTVCHRADSSYARRVFSHEQFYRTISSAQQERLIMCHVVKALHRHLFKVTAVLVSITAISFRERYDLPGFVDSIEKPFEWSDPAQPILNQRRKTHSLFTTIIESQFPCTVPHIVIDDAPPQPPWIGTMNYVNHGYEQDVERLYVPQAVYGFSTTYDEAVEVQSTPEEKEWAEVVETWDYEYGLDGIPELSLSQLMEAESPPDSPVVRTPSTKPDSLVSVSIYPVDPGDDIDDPEFLLPDAYATSSGKLLSEELAMATCQFTLVIHPPSEDSFTRTGFDIFDDDEEELPPLSGWCLDTWKQMQEQEQQALEVC
ncbi:hypothetical protein JAAARDRAFT_28006 [Jaapia argillacea MUCL 33604]|uniref:Uncharacterized protein n=1 Tax=Jaapia argillacea MUCL 33604 TaxID=933084 RepID=A0A067QLI4_9AGAM|nr:hypothetical protein JAAARDRAFT_28006 [Jaapia argillacea MUCL 33604]